jgi:prolyl-tRNA synthetase
MRMSELLVKTERQVAATADLASHQLLLRAGLVAQIASGIYTLTPLARRAMRHIEAVVRGEMERIGGQEVLMSLVQPAELWQESGRYQKIGAELVRFRDRGDRQMLLAMTHEEAATALVRSMVGSYQQLPLLLFQVQTKFRDEARPRGGLIRLREFIMKDGYSFHTSRADLDRFYEDVLAAYRRIFARLELPVLLVEADTGMMGGWESHEFVLLNESGEDTVLVCPGCGYAANAEIAAFAHSSPGERSGAGSEQTAVSEIATPGATTIAALCAAAGCEENQTLKAVFFAPDGGEASAGEREVILALIRGDLEVNELKLRTLLGVQVRSLSAAEASERGLVTGYAGPVDLRVPGRVRVVADDSVVKAGPLLAGANREGYHLRGVSYGRDYLASATGDIAQARAGYACARCGRLLEARRGIEVGHTFKLGTVYSAKMAATFAGDGGGAQQPIIMASYGIGITRLLACTIEQHHDQAGIMWPESVAPYTYHLLIAGYQAAAEREAAETVYRRLGEEVTLYDDRSVSTGVKLKDADLLGMPLRITVSQRSLANGGVELRRRTGETGVASLAEVKRQAARLLAGR